MLMQVRVPPDPQLPPDLRSQGEQWALGATEPTVFDRMNRMVLANIQSAVAWIVEYLLKIAARVAIYFAGAVMRAEDRNALEFRALSNAALKDLTGLDAGAGHKAIGKTLLEGLAGGPGAAPGGVIAPSTAGAEAYMEIVMQLALEGYLQGGLTSALSATYLDKFTELDDILSQVRGLGRMSRRVIGPLLNARVITPFQWHVNKQYRPELLSPGEAIRQFVRHNWTHEQLTEELARQGWSAERIDAMIEGQRKFFSPSDVRQFVTRNHWSEDLAQQHLLDQGYTEEEARDTLRLEGLKRFEQLEAQEGAAIVTAYANREIDEREFDDLMNLMIQNPTERNLLTELAGVRRRVNVKRLSSAEERRLAIAEIRAPIDYRRALEREGYQPDAVAALDLELRAILADQRADEAAPRGDRRRAPGGGAARRRGARRASGGDRRGQGAPLRGRHPARLRPRAFAARSVHARDRRGASGDRRRRSRGARRRGRSGSHGIPGNARAAPASGARGGRRRAPVGGARARRETRATHDRGVRARSPRSRVRRSGDQHSRRRVARGA